jgi:hypothetical protein
VNPRTVVLPSAEPVPGEAQEAFEAARAERMRLLPASPIDTPPALVALVQPAGGAATP